MIEFNEFVKKFTPETMEGVVKINRNFFQVNEELMKVKNKVKQEPFAIGTYLGTGKPFHPGVALLDWLGERTKKYVVVDKKAAWLFLCGRDLFRDSILEAGINRGKVIVKNENGEVLGLGEFTGRKVAVKNLLDKGDFLRRERH